MYAFIYRNAAWIFMCVCALACLCMFSYRSHRDEFVYNECSRLYLKSIKSSSRKLSSSKLSDSDIAYGYDVCQEAYLCIDSNSIKGIKSANSYQYFKDLVYASVVNH